MKIPMNAIESTFCGIKGFWIPDIDGDPIKADGFLVDPLRWFWWKVTNEFWIFWLGLILDWRRIWRRK